MIGHRGASGRFPENTILSFQRAVEAGVDAIEFDVRMSSDGVPVVIHDPTLDRTTNRSGPVAAYSAAELGKAEVGPGEGVPRFIDVLEAFPALPCLVEIKEVAAAAAVRVVVQRTGSSKRVLIGSFVHAALTPLRGGDIKTAASRREAAVFWGTSRLGLRPPFRRYKAFSLPEWSGRIHAVDGAFLTAAKRAGIPVHVWTVDDPSDAERLWSLGVNGVITNRPDLLVGVRPDHT